MNDKNLNRGEFLHPSKNANGTKKRLAESTRPDERSDDISKSPRISGGLNGNDVGELSYDECKIAYKMFNETASELLYDQELHSSKQDISILTPFPDDEDKEIDWGATFARPADFHDDQDLIQKEALFDREDGQGPSLQERSLNWWGIEKPPSHLQP
mmetsp:Transcript_13926/g.18251  ORF Transcript_13926/g.18251 Transcript_13926/m.18251 type:complete len:157 (-) Transcript_13926:381-851(-)|eukprot:CAMPEP_0116064800 /NCGR_PEP_ID=MMETSP0322-20121206/9337_1 /TAXON_ID=163516 /ORGANISM="Leptocylindrus danicus var. apora, Strain B651" /LENGTH=156 /DNA_ID=CAMNT_0003550901 /DNA_START=633 /DNA_END=1103 /DNA_ORIENTATION=+